MTKASRPIIIKRKKIVAGGHHGGAWKVAYADFVTAMMAFFMLMWLLNATTETQRKGIADYFDPTIPINRISGGGADVFGGDSVFSEDDMAQSGAGASRVQPTEVKEARGDAGRGETGTGEEMRQALEDMLRARGGESMTMERALRHVVTKVTDEGLVIEIFDLPDVALFEADNATPRRVLRDVAWLLADVLPITKNAVAISAHVKTYPVTLKDNPVWQLSADRAQAMRGVLADMGFEDGRVKRVTGHADRSPVTENSMAVRNNRIEVILLRRDR